MLQAPSETSKQILPRTRWVSQWCSAGSPAPGGLLSLTKLPGSSLPPQHSMGCLGSLKSWGIFPILFAAFLPSLLSFFLFSFLKQSCVSPLAPSYHCISWWPNTLTPKATHRKPTTWDGRRDQLWLRLTSREHPSWGRLSPGRLMEAYFTSCHSFLWSFCQTRGDSYSSFPLSSCTLVIYSLYIPLPKKWLQSPSCSQVEDRTFFKPIFTTIFCIFIIHSTDSQNSLSRYGLVWCHCHTYTPHIMFPLKALTVFLTL